MSDCWNMVIVYTGVCMNRYYKINDSWFTYYVNINNGEKKFTLDKDDVLVECHPDDFWR